MIYTYQHNGDTYTVNLQRQPDGSYTATIVRGHLADRSYLLQAKPIPSGGWLLTLDGRQVTAYVAAQDDTRYVTTGGHAYTLTVPDKRQSRRKASGGNGDLTAQMPGQVLDVQVAVGDTVERGQTLVILEAMKMEIRVTAPDAGIVKRLLVAKGDVVERGQLLLEIG
jgi:biotin carboxyl carrier protein